MLATSDDQAVLGGARVSVPALSPGECCEWTEPGSYSVVSESLLCVDSDQVLPNSRSVNQSYLTLHNFFCFFFLSFLDLFQSYA